MQNNIEDKIKTIRYTGELYRADRTIARIGNSAANNYREAPMKYFTLHKHETSAYTQYGMPFVKTWTVSEDKPLILIDIMNRTTRNSIKTEIGTDAFNIAFPINAAGNVYRVSEENTKHMNNTALRTICQLGQGELGKYDGYIMQTQQERNSVGFFHSEVGLCPSAFSKLKLSSVERVAVPPPIKPRNAGTKRIKRTRGNIQSNSRLGFKQNSRTNSPWLFKQGRLGLEQSSRTNSINNLSRALLFKSGLTNSYVRSPSRNNRNTKCLSIIIYMLS